MATAYHMVHYRHFEIDGGETDRTLEDLLREALSTKNQADVTLWERANDRSFDLDDGSGGQILLNKVADLHSAVFGEMCFVDPKGLQALLQRRASRIQLSDITTAEVFDLSERQAPQGLQFIRGLLYWIAIGDHLFFVKTQAMTSDRLHSYFHWLMKINAGTVANDVTFRLQAAVDRAAHAGDIGDIRSLRVSGRAPQIVRPVPEPGEREVAVDRVAGSRSLLFEQARPIAEAIFGPEKIESLVSTFGPKEYLAVDATVAVRGRRTESSKAKMKELVNEVADRDEGRVQIQAKDGVFSDGDAILRTRMPFDVPDPSATLLDFDNVADQLREVYSRFVRDGKLPA